MDPNEPTLNRRHHQRLREIYRSAGWPCQDSLEVELIAAGQVERLRSAEGHETLRLTDAERLEYATAEPEERYKLCSTARTKIPVVKRVLDQHPDEPALVIGDNQPYDVSDATDYAIPVHGERRGREITYLLTDHHIGHIVSDALAHTEEPTDARA